jgi:hypothetical protein
MGLGILASNIDHVARLGKKEFSELHWYVQFTSFVTDLESAEKCKNWQVHKSEWQMGTEICTEQIYTLFQGR